MTYKVRFTRAASDDLDRLYGFIVDRDDDDRTVTILALRHQRESDYH
jgi:plasmid stabilization system protein ParE